MGNEGSGARQGRGGGAGSVPVGPARLGSRDIRTPPHVRFEDGMLHKGTVTGLAGNSYIQMTSQKMWIYNRGGGAGNWVRYVYTRRAAGVTWSRLRSEDTDIRSIVTLNKKLL